VATVDLTPGQMIEPGHLRWIGIPSEVVHHEGDPTGSVAIAPITAGEVVHPDRVADTGPLGLRATERAVAVLPPLAPLPLSPGHVVELVSVAADPASGSAVTTRLDSPGRVLAVADDAVTIAVPAEMAAEVVGYQATGSVELVLTPWAP
jgi:hypothetical protein